jgi:hypothetical protein
MPRSEASVTINRALQVLRDYLDDTDNWPVYQTGQVKAEKTSEGFSAAGSTFRGIDHFLGRTIKSTAEIAAQEESEGFCETATNIQSGPISLEQTQTLKAVEGGTHVTVVNKGTTGGLFRLAYPLVVRMYGRDTQADLERLKDILEAEE